VTAPCPTLGFLVEFDIDAGVSRDRADALWRAFMAAVGERGLVADGGTSWRTWTYRIHSEASQATDLDRHAVREWAASRREILASRVGELIEL
jgi:uncharacterized protein YggL (DUF469 family)